MKSRTRLALESLEERWCPALTAKLAAGVLTISGTATTSIQVTQDSTTAGTISVKDGNTAVGASPFTGVTAIRLNLTKASDNVTIDLGGQSFSGDVAAHLGGGADSLTVLNGTIEGNLAIVADAAGPAKGKPPGAPPAGVPGGQVGGNLGGPGLGGTGTPPANLAGPRVADTGADTVNIQAGATVGNLFLRSGAAGGTFTVAGDVTGDLSLDANAGAKTTGGTTLSVTGGVDGQVDFSGGIKDDTFTISGDVGGGVHVISGGGGDHVTISGGVTEDLLIDTGAGNDTIALSGLVGGQAHINAGTGVDSLSISTASAQFLDKAVVNMGGGNDSVTLDDSAAITTMLINGGTGTDTFTGTRARPGLHLLSI